MPWLDDETPTRETRHAAHTFSGRCAFPDVYTELHARTHPTGTVWVCPECGTHWEITDWDIRSSKDAVPEWRQLVL